MDPNANLEQQRAARRTLDTCTAMHLDGKLCNLCSNAALDLAELCAALDGWITRGGFYPAAWQHHEPEDRTRFQGEPLPVKGPCPRCGRIDHVLCNGAR